jgi:flagellin-like protein
MKSKKGLSGIVMTIILIALVLVAAAIVWAIVSNLLEGKGEDISIADKCLGLNIKPTALSCDMDECNVTLERALVSESGEIEGVGITFSNAEYTAGEASYPGDIIASKKITRDVSTSFTSKPTKVDVRIYFKNEADEAVYCSQINSYP